MIARADWKDRYTEDDSFRSPWRKNDLVYLLNKFGVKADGERPSRRELEAYPQPQLNRIWAKIKPQEFGLRPEEVGA